MADDTRPTAPPPRFDSWMLVPRTDVAGLLWPSLPSPIALHYSALLYQLEQTQWWPAERLRQWQFLQLERLLAVAEGQIPFYRERLRRAGFRAGRPLTEEVWSALPILRRREIQDAGERLIARGLPEGHGKIFRNSTSGSTGSPLTMAKSEMALLYWRAFVLREALWSGLDLSGKLAIVRKSPPGRPKSPNGTPLKDWGDPLNAMWETGPAVHLDKDFDVAVQAAWLAAEKADVLFTWPTLVRALAAHCRDSGLALDGLKVVRTFGEVVDSDLRALAREAWGARVFDTYSAEDGGYMAIQCPEHNHYHVQAESGLVEILDDAGRSCRPGEVGRVVVTHLHNFAMPLVRYDIEDLAEVGPPCPCGRGLPVLARILGRQRNMLRLPDGTRRFPSFRNDAIAAIDAIRQYQIVQTGLDQLAVRLVVSRPLTAEEAGRFCDEICKLFGYRFNMNLEYRDSIPRSGDGKFEDFRSEIGG